MNPYNMCLIFLIYIFGILIQCLGIFKLPSNGILTAIGWHVNAHRSTNVVVGVKNNGVLVHKLNATLLGVQDPIYSVPNIPLSAGSITTGWESASTTNVEDASIRLYITY